MNIVYPQKKVKGAVARGFAPGTLLRKASSLMEDSPLLYVRTANDSYPLMDLRQGCLIASGHIGTIELFVEVKHTLNIEE